MRAKFLGFVVWLIYRSLSLTWKLVVIEPPSLQQRLRARAPCLFAHWHGDELVLVSLIKRYRACTMVSQSKDGEIMDVFFRLMGGWTARGSSSKGGSSALRKLVGLIKKWQFNASMAVDGPRGPRFHVKPGIFQLQRLLLPESIPIFAGGVTASSCWRFHRSWNKAILPKPFATVIIYWKETNILIAKDDDPRDQTFVDILTQDLALAHQEAEKSLNNLSS